MGNNATIPDEIGGGWNWGAFLLGLIWGVGNNVWWSLLLLVPFFDVVWIFIMGIKGNEWAWKSKRWESIEHFKQVQKQWSLGGLIFAGVGVVVWIAIYVAN
ncbi:ribonuclease G [Chloroflexota bacterium]